MTLVRLEQQRLLAASMQVESTSQHALPHTVLGGLQQTIPALHVIVDRYAARDTPGAHLLAVHPTTVQPETLSAP